ncbi:MAG: tRNA lysidine(34) synthetase TilS [Oscillospiraceae bacterium]|nr:tRNA lysidine(34) synthetase TilS [Oscillospiraceae bacterium]
MLNKLLSFVRRYDMIAPGDRVVCAVSGGADSIALLWAMYCLKDKLQIDLAAAHFNHGLRGSESDRDEQFVRDFCRQYEIPFFSQKSNVVAGAKGLEAAAREARYGYLRTLPGKIATAHTANDNAETVLMHLVRGTGLKGLGAIAPVKGQIIRPMLSVTRAEVLAFLEEYHIGYVNDSSNETDQFLRNRLRHRVMPLLEQENPRLAEDLSAMALSLREDERELDLQTQPVSDVEQLRKMSSSRRRRCLMAFLHRCNVPEPEREHIALLESLVFSQNPSARADLPGGVTVARNYGKLEVLPDNSTIGQTELLCPGVTEVPQLGIRVICQEADDFNQDKDCFTVQTQGQLVLRSRQQGDAIRLSGGRKSLKKLFIDRKVPASLRNQIPVIADEKGILGVYGFGPNLDRTAKEKPAIQIRFETFI